MSGKFILFCRQFPCPPNSPKAVCTVLEIECAHGAVFVAGKIFSLEYMYTVNLLSFLNNSPDSSPALFLLLLGGSGYFACLLFWEIDLVAKFSLDSIVFLKDHQEMCYLKCHAKGKWHFANLLVSIRDGQVEIWADVDSNWSGEKLQHKRGCLITWNANLKK